MRHTIALFGEAEKGRFKEPHFFQKLPHLLEAMGNPPEESQGLHFAVQSILYERDVLYFRVEEEGYSAQDYLWGLHYLQNKEHVKVLHALCLPGVGDGEILGATKSICDLHKSILIMSEKDLYDYLTYREK